MENHRVVCDKVRPTIYISPKMTF